MFSPDRKGSLAFQSSCIASRDGKKLLAGNIELLSDLQETMHMRKGEK